MSALPWQPEQVKVVDVTDRAVRLPDIDALVILINEGAYDDHLEALLAAAHGRKRDKRGLHRPYGVIR